ncbi:hypothetical protein [Paenibacillus cremeus]|uniref:Uncharacterized protein n=1 Tax=Paenibacillus cremeus TaxID=2163881 RepID=A0A559KCM6_9BACL|nr:hypothetical protein [Paenibacillus cremeus]TVY09881.1 hypothetical protein FPZ49_10945 [Paenibacillus cremeus]
MSYTPAERETVLQCDDESKTWTITSCQPTVITKLKKSNLEPYKVTDDGMHWYKDIPFSQVSFRSVSKRKPMSDEQRQAAADRLRKAREKQ